MGIDLDIELGRFAPTTPTSVPGGLFPGMPIAATIRPRSTVRIVIMSPTIGILIRSVVSHGRASRSW